MDAAEKTTETAPSLSRFPAVPMRHALARAAGAAVEAGPHPGLLARDLCLGEASAGQMAGHHLSAEYDGGAAVWHSGPAPAFAFIQLTAGRLSADLDGEMITLAAGDTATTDFLALGRDWRWSADFEAVSFVAPADAAAPVDPVELLRFDPVAPTRDRALAGLTRDRPETYKAGEGPRRFLEYRDLATIASTDRRIHIHQVRAIATPPGGTGWHVHSMSQIFYVFRGWVDISVEGAGTVRMVAGDAMCIAADMRHNVSSFSADYDLVEMCLPADYSTVPRPAPAEAQP